MTLASNAVPETAELANSLPHERANLCAMVALEFGDFAVSVMRDNQHARETGKTLVNAYVNPDGREGDGSARIKTYPTDLTWDDLNDALDRVAALARLAARVRHDDDALSQVLDAQRSAMARLGSLDSELWSAWVRSEKAHLPGPAAALLDVDGFAWTRSLKGHATTVRYDESAQKRTRENRSEHAYVETHAMLSERDLSDIYSEEG